MPMRDENLAVVIPVWNLPEDLARLLGQIEQIGIFSEVIVVDDASELDCNPEHLGFSSERLGARLLYQRIAVQGGAGHARNVGLSLVTASNVLFFDADDMMVEGLSDIWRQHVGQDGIFSAEDGVPDFTIFRHNDSRVLEAHGREGSFPGDEKLWDKALGGADQKALSHEERAHLAVISAYPWNKIYRTAFLREAGIDCSETPVHNDIRLHWLSFLRAGQIRATRTIGAVHVVEDRPHHLTTRRGAERLCIEDILVQLIAAIRATPGQEILMRHFLHFTDTVCRWNLDQVAEEVLPQFVALAGRSYRRFTPDEFRIYAQWQPDRAAAIVKFLVQEGV